MAEHPINGLMERAMQSIKDMVDVNTVIGDAIQTASGITVIPFSKVSFGFATGGGEFDVVMVSNYETPMWAENGWLTNLQDYADGTQGYDPDDFIPSIREALSYEDDLYSVPFYGEAKSHYTGTGSGVL